MHKPTYLWKKKRRKNPKVNQYSCLINLLKRGLSRVVHPLVLKSSYKKRNNFMNPFLTVSGKSLPTSLMPFPPQVYN